MPATNAWLRSRFLSSPGWRRIRSRQTSSVSAGSSASGPISSSRHARDGALDARRQEVDLAHLRGVPIADLRVGVGGRQPRRATGPARRLEAFGRARLAEPEDDGGLARQLGAGRGQLEATGEHRVDDDPVAIEVDEEELAALADARDSLPDEGFELIRRAPDGERSGSLAAVIGRPRKAASKASATIVRSGNSGTAARL